MKAEMKRTMHWIAIIAVTVFLAAPATAQIGPIVREAGEMLLEALGKRGAREIAEAGGEVVVRKMAQRALREGGEEALQAVTRLARANGGLAVRALSNADDIARMARVIDQVPARDTAKALQALAGMEGRQIARLAETYGAKALVAEARNPGVASRIIRVFGQDGADASGRLTNKEMLDISRYADDIAAMGAGAKETVGRMLATNAKEFARFCGQFVKENPGKLMTLAAILAFQEELIGKTRITTGPDGMPLVVHAPGFFERSAGAAATRMWNDLLPWILGSFGVGSGIFLWHFWAVRKLKRSILRQRLAAVSGAPIRSEGGTHGGGTMINTAHSAVAVPERLQTPKTTESVC